MKKHYIILIFTLLATFSLKAQTVKVIDKISKKGIPNIEIFNQHNSQGVTTDENGIADLSFFSKNEKLFFKHTAFETIQINKSELAKNNYQLFMYEKIQFLDEIVFSSNKTQETRSQQAHMIDVIKAKQIENIPAQNSADILLHTGNITIQKSQGGGGSPVIRGFEANKVLLVLDGVRMNNAIYRSGHLQNAITVDNSILERTEIVYGPTSSMYGSDALGGVIHYYTKTPSLNKKLSLNAYTQYSTANEGKKAHINIEKGFGKIASLSSFTYSNFEDIRMGENRSNDTEEEYGRTYYYVTQDKNGKDINTKNSDPEIQKNTGYKQYDFLQKIRFSPSKNLDIIANVQYSTSSDIDRYDKLNDYKDKAKTKLKFAEWYYGPQNRLFTSLQIRHKKSNILYDNFTTTLAFQDIEESRISRKFGSGKAQHQEEKVKVYSVNLDLSKKFTNSRLNYGFEWTYNDVNSEAYYKYLDGSPNKTAQTRYPNNGSTVYNLATYLNYNYKISSKMNISAGGRFNYSYLNSKFDDEYLPFDKIKIEAAAPSGNISFIYRPIKGTQINLIASRGFRCPNVDDYGKVRAKGEEVTVPNDELKPEYADNLELSITQNLSKNIRFNITGYHTWLSDAIVRSNHQINNNDSLSYDGDKYKIIINKNASDAVIYGLSSSLVGSFNFAENNHIRFKSTLNYTYGHDETNNSPLGHISPLFGQTSINYGFRKFDFNIYSFYCAKKELKDFSKYGEDNNSEATATGYPSWFTLNAGFAYRINKFISLQFAVENILDAHYKTFASGVSAPGRNFTTTLRVSL